MVVGASILPGLLCATDKFWLAEERHSQTDYRSEVRCLPNYYFHVAFVEPVKIVRLI